MLRIVVTDEETGKALVDEKAKAISAGICKENESCFSFGASRGTAIEIAKSIDAAQQCIEKILEEDKGEVSAAYVYLKLFGKDVTEE